MIGEAGAVWGHFVVDFLLIHELTFHERVFSYR